jgi:hypothetical protein
MLKLTFLVVGIITVTSFAIFAQSFAIDVEVVDEEEDVPCGMPPEIRAVILF